MTLRWKILLSVVLAAALACFLLYELCWKEPSYQGRSLSEWLATLDNATPERQQEVIVAVRKMGGRALPHALDMLHAKDSPERQKVIEFLNENTIIKIAPEVPAEKQRQRALLALAALGKQQPKVVLEHLAMELLEPESAGDAASMLAIIMGTNGLPALLQALTNKVPDIRWSAASALSAPCQILRQTNANVLRHLGACGVTLDELCSNAKVFSTVAAPSLLECLRDSNAQVRRNAVASLEAMGVKSAKVIPVLTTELRSTNAWDRRWSAEMLRRFAKIAEEAVPALVQALDDSDETVRAAAREALTEIDPKTAEKYRSGQ